MDIFITFDDSFSGVIHYVKNVFEKYEKDGTELQPVFIRTFQVQRNLGDLCGTYVGFNVGPYRTQK
eukprot:14781404-Ditylum_brightwellii.AAC.1